MGPSRSLVLIVIPSIVLATLHLDTQAGLLGDILTSLRPLPILFMPLFTLYQGVVNAHRALIDQSIRYPLSIPFIS
jgi:hypothetical protein